MQEFKQKMIKCERFTQKFKRKRWQSVSDLLEKIKQKKDDKVQIICLKIQVRKSLFLKNLICTLFVIFAKI